MVGYFFLLEYKMFGAIKNLSRKLGIVAVKEDNNIITINGIDVALFVADIKEQYQTSKVATNMFISYTASSIKFHSFFLIDVEYIVRFLSNQRKTKLGKRTYIKIIEEIKENTWLGRLEKSSPSIFDKSKIKEIKYDLLKHQSEFIDYYDKVIPRYKLKGLLMAAAPGTGKGLLHGTPVRTINGWTAVEDLKVNDKVMGETGEFHNVTGVYPQGEKELYKLTFKDGRSVTTDGDHIWTVKTKEGMRDYNTLELYKMQTERKQGLDRRYIPLVNISGYENNIELPIDPWVMGVLLGDGSLANNTITINKPDEWLQSRLHNYLTTVGVVFRFEKYIRLIETAEGIKESLVMQTCIPSSVSEKNKEFHAILEELKLKGCVSNNKFVPKIYLTAGHNQRLELIKGLMDTDGYANGIGNSVEYGTVSKQLADDMKELLWSIGCIVKCTEKQPTYTYKGEKREGQLFYRFSIRYRHPADLFESPTKRLKLPLTTQYSDGLHLGISKVEKLEYTGKTTCISVDNPTKLFVTKDYIVTHNTISSIAVACAYGSENVIIVAPKNSVFRVWEATLRDSMAVEQTYWVYASGQPEPPTNQNRWYIYHYEALDKAIELSKSLGSKKCCVILDESHNFNDIKSLRTERFIKMCQGMKNSIIVELSGTPMKALGFEAIPLIKAIDPLFTDACVDAFKKMYGKEAKKATSILANRLGIIMYKVEANETEIQEPIEHTVKVTVRDAERFTLEALKVDMANFIKQRTVFYNTNKAAYEATYNRCMKIFEEKGLPLVPKKDDYITYKKYIREFADRGYDPYTSPPKAVFCNTFEKNYIIPSLPQDDRSKFRDAKSVVKYVDLKIRGECLGTVLSKARMECNRAVLEALDIASIIDNAEKKTLVFTSYVEVVKSAEKKLIDLGYKPLTVFAETNNQLPAIIKQFGNDDNVNPLIATYQSLSTAVPLTMANRIILLNAPFRIHEKEQTVARANRLGQDKTVHVFNVFLDTGDTPNISTRSNDIMEWSKEQVNQLMGFKNDIAVGLESVEHELSENNYDKYVVSSFNEDGTVDGWDVPTMWKLTSGIPTTQLSVDELFEEIEDIVSHYDKDDIAKIDKADLNYPIIYNQQIGVVDGIHRIAKAKKLNQSMIPAVVLNEMPSPHHHWKSMTEYEDYFN